MTNFGIQSLQSAFQKNDTVWTESTRRRVFGHLSAVRHRRPPLSAPTASPSCHAPSGCLRRDPHSLRALHFAPPLSRRAPPRFGELFRLLLRVSGRASPPRAPPRPPLPRRPLHFLSQAPVRSHCPLRRELHLAGVHRDHRQRGQTSLVHLWL